MCREEGGGVEKGVNGMSYLVRLPSVTGRGNGATIEGERSETSCDVNLLCRPCLCYSSVRSMMRCAVYGG